MKAITNIKNAIRDFCRNHDEYIFPMIKFVFCYLVFSSTVMMFPYSDLFNKSTVVLLLSVLCALLSDSFTFFFAGVIMAVNSFQINLEVGAVFLVFFMFMYSSYLRFFPKTAFIILLVPFCFQINMPYLIPILAMIVGGFGGAFSSGFGVMIYYFANCVSEVRVMLDAAADEDSVEVLKYFSSEFVKNKEMYLYAGVFIITVLIASVIRSFSFDFSGYIAVLVAAIAEYVTFSKGAVKAAVAIDMNAVLSGIFVALLIAMVIQFWKGILDYRHKEVVQFEDDEYYYYVKAVPKLYAKHKKGNDKALEEDYSTDRYEDEYYEDDDYYDDLDDDDFMHKDKILRPEGYEMTTAEKESARKRAEERQAVKNRSNSGNPNRMTKVDAEGNVMNPSSGMSENGNPNSASNSSRVRMSNDLNNRNNKNNIIDGQPSNEPANNSVNGSESKVRIPKNMQKDANRDNQNASKKQNIKNQKAQKNVQGQQHVQKHVQNQQYIQQNVQNQQYMQQNAQNQQYMQQNVNNQQNLQYQQDLQMLQYYQEQERLRQANQNSGNNNN